MSGVKRCKFCGREGARMTAIRNRWIDRIDGWKCASPIACIRRQAQLGQWIGKRALYRQDVDGTRWTIRRVTVGVSGGPLYALTCEYRQHRSMSNHFTVDAAKAHADEMIASLTNPNVDDYRVDEPAEVNQPELAP